MNVSVFEMSANHCGSYSIPKIIFIFVDVLALENLLLLGIDALTLSSEMVSTTTHFFYYDVQ